MDDHLGFVSALAGLTRPGGMVTMSTINRTAKVRENSILPVQNVEHVDAYIILLIAIIMPSMSNQECRWIFPGEVESASVLPR